MASEFSIIDRYFNNIGQHKNIEIGSGDDAAVIQTPTTDQSILTCIKTFNGDEIAKNNAAILANQAIDELIARLADHERNPLALLLNLSLSSIDQNWLKEFSAAVDKLAQQHGFALVGGDTTSGYDHICFKMLG